MNIYLHSPETNSPSGDARNINSDEIVYRAEALPFQVPTPPWGLAGENGTTLPIQGGPHPHIAGLFADTYEIRQYGMQSLIRFRYSNNRQWRQASPPPDRTEPGYSAWEMSSDVAQVKIPFLLKVPEVIPLPGGSTVTRQVWTVTEETVPEAGTVTTWRGSVPDFRPDAAEALIHAQVGKIHQIPLLTGAKRQFIGARFSQITSRWSSEYRWRIDHGTARPASWVDTATRIYPPTIATLAGVAYVRLPYQVFEVIPSTDPYNVPPTIAVKVMAAEVLNGWVSLGVPPP